ncbi:hypothetical protein ABH922_001802 [Rhodococcus sp. 27YEA15]
MHLAARLIGQPIERAIVFDAATLAGRSVLGADAAHTAESHRVRASLPYRGAGVSRQAIDDRGS